MKKILICWVLVCVILLVSCSNEEQINLSEPQTVVEESVSVEGSESAEESGVRKQNMGIDYISVAEVLGISAEDLETAIDANIEQGNLDYESTAAHLNVDVNLLSEALADAGFGSGMQNRGAGGIGGVKEIDYVAAAASLNISEAELRNALDNNVQNNGPIDFEQAALELGVSKEELLTALGIMGGGNRK